MNFSPVLGEPTAIVLALLAPMMWGTWFISLKHLKGYPIEGFYMTLFGFALIFVWSVGLFFDGKNIFVNIGDVWRQQPLKIVLIVIGGISYVCGMFISLRVMTLIGLALSQPLSSSINFVVGTIITTSVGGKPESLRLWQIITSLCFLLSAVFLVFFAQKIKNRSQLAKKIDTGLSRDPNIMKKAVLLIILASMFSPGYTFALSYGLKTVTQPVGLAVLPFMCLLCSGAFIGAFITSGITLTKRKQWHVIWTAPFKIHKWGIMSGLFHYGGNIIHTFATGVLSSAVSWPLGLTAGIWTQLWGIKYGEFRGAPVKAYVIQFASFLCYVLGAFFIVMSKMQIPLWFLSEQ